MLSRTRYREKRFLFLGGYRACDDEISDVSANSSRWRGTNPLQINNSKVPAKNYMAKITQEDRQLLSALGAVPVADLNGSPRDPSPAEESLDPSARAFLEACRAIYDDERWKTAYAALQAHELPLKDYRSLVSQFFKEQDEKTLLAKLAKQPNT